MWLGGLGFNREMREEDIELMFMYGRERKWDYVMGDRVVV